MRLSDHADIEHGVLQSFLNVLSRRFARQDILLVLDGAPNHRCRDLLVPRNITLLFLPPYAPELNPKENLWDEIREKISETMPSNLSTPCIPNSMKPSATSIAIRNS